MERPLAPDDQPWPCNTGPAARDERSDRLVSFLYVLLRDGATAPGDVEQHALNVRKANDTVFCNQHLESYARSLATYLTS